MQFISIGFLSCLLLLSACSAVNPTSTAQKIPSVVEAAPSRPVKIGLALGGGAARGFAHVGVIKVLEAHGIVPDLVVGTSAGSLVGALYAAGNKGFALHQLALEMDESAISDWSVSLFAKSVGMLKGEAIQNYVNRSAKNVRIEKLPVQFGAVATDLNSGMPILFRRGNLGQAVRASSAVPGVFQSVKIGERFYVDGGLASPVPARFAREMGADFVIAVDISARPESQAAETTMDVLLQTFAIMGKNLNRYELTHADVVIRPALDGMKGGDFAGRNAAILAGEQAAASQISEIKRKLHTYRRQ